jgi:NAD(P)-dependent dehydrogenase (short-subunit alcohol dehydrogenase family)
MSNHDLVIGGSGMLAGLCEALAGEGRRVSVLARGRAALDRVAARNPGIMPISADYTDTAALDTALQAAAGAAGPIDRAICWIHSTAPEAPLIVARHVQQVYCHVLGSAATDPAAPHRLDRWRARFAALPHLDYRIVVLGFVLDAGGGSRWLTNDEISAGVKRAFDSDAPLSVVGRVEPWSARP